MPQLIKRTIDMKIEEEYHLFLSQDSNRLRLDQLEHPSSSANLSHSSIITERSQQENGPLSNNLQTDSSSKKHQNYHSNSNTLFQGPYQRRKKIYERLYLLRRKQNQKHYEEISQILKNQSQHLFEFKQKQLQNLFEFKQKQLENIFEKPKVFLGRMNDLDDQYEKKIKMFECQIENIQSRYAKRRCEIQDQYNKRKSQPQRQQLNKFHERNLLLIQVLERNMLALQSIQSIRNIDNTFKKKSNSPQKIQKEKRKVIKKVPIEIKNKIIEQYKNHYNCREIHKKYRDYCHYNTVLRIVKDEKKKQTK